MRILFIKMSLPACDKFLNFHEDKVEATLVGRDLKSFKDRPSTSIGQPK